MENITTAELNQLVLDTELVSAELAEFSSGSMELAETVLELHAELQLPVMDTSKLETIAWKLNNFSIALKQFRIEPKPALVSELAKLSSDITEYMAEYLDNETARHLATGLVK